MAQYLKPPWMQRNVGNRLAPLFNKSLIAKLSVQGRKTGQWHTVPVAVLDYRGERLLVSYRGESDWAANLRAAGTGRLASKGQTETIQASEVPVDERADILREYRAQFGKMPTVTSVLDALPDPGDHPIFRISTR